MCDAASRSTFSLSASSRSGVRAVVARRRQLHQQKSSPHRVTSHDESLRPAAAAAATDDDVDTDSRRLSDAAHSSYM